MLVHNELDIEQTNDADAKSEFFGVVKNGLFHLIGKAVGRIHADRIAGMHAGSLHKLHNARDKDLLSITDRIHLDLFTADVLVHQNRLVFIDFNGGLQVAAQCFFLGNDLHSSSAKHEAGTNKHRIANLSGSPEASLNARYSLPFGLRDVQRKKQFFKGIAVFGAFNGVAVGTDDPDTPRTERRSQIDRGLSAECRNDAFRLLHLNDVHDVFHTQRLKIELIRTGVVSRNRFWIVVDDDGLVAGRLDGLHRMNRGIVKLHALTDTDRA